MSYAIAAAGTGGHVFPGLAVGEALVASGVAHDDVLYIGGSRLESIVYPDHGFPFLAVELAGLQRRLTTENLRIPLVVKRATAQIASVIDERRVGAVLGMGGYVTVPAGLAARRREIPLAVSEQNAHAGLANRVMSKLAEVAFGAFPETRGMPRARWVGNPVRAGVLEHVDPMAARERYGLPRGGFVVGAFGGSLGAGAINTAIADSVDEWSRHSISVLHLVGERNRRIAEGAEGHGHWVVVPFEERMQDFYAACDLVVARSGGAVAELTATGTPSILVPGTFGSGGHQSANAGYLADAGAAVVIAEEDLHDLADVVIALSQDRRRLDEMAAATRKLAKPDAAAIIAGELRSMHG